VTRGFWRRCGSAIVAALLLSSVPVVAALGQGNCTRNGNGTCAVGGTATYGLTLTITKASRVTVSTLTVTLPSPTLANYQAGVGSNGTLGVIVQANTPWSLAVAAVNATWTASPGGRANKPAEDLQWATAFAGPYTDMTTVNATVSSGTATAATNFTVHFRVKYAWTLDSPGDYNLPLRLVLTAP